MKYYSHNNIILNEMVTRYFGQLLLEAMSLSDIKHKWYNDVDDEAFANIIQADPTYNAEKPDKIGQYAKWLLNLYRQGKLKLEDLYKATQYLTVFDKAKRMKKIQDADINKVKSLPDLYERIRQFLPEDDGGESPLVSQSDKNRQISSGAEKVFENDEWIVIVPHTMEAAIKYGKGTQWCTAATDSHNYFDYYNSRGKLYIIMDKYSKHKYQFHFETNSFMDENDRKIDKTCFFKKYDKSKSLFRFFKKERPKDYLSFICDEIDGVEEDLFKIMLYDIDGYGTRAYNFIDNNDNIISNEWFADIEDFSHGWALVEPVDSHDWYYNFINRYGDFIDENGFKDASSFDENGFALVTGFDDKEKVICADKDKCLDNIIENHDDFDIVEYNDMKAFLSKNERNIIMDTWFGDIIISETKYGKFAIIQDSRKWYYNILDTTTWKQLRSNEDAFPFDNVDPHCNDGFFRVMLYDRLDYLNVNGKWLSEMSNNTDIQILEKGYNFHNGYALVMATFDYEVCANFVDTKGRLVYKKWFNDYRVKDATSIIVPYNGKNVIVKGESTSKIFERKIYKNNDHKILEIKVKDIAKKHFQNNKH